MSKKCSVWMSKPSLSSMKTDLTTIKLIDVKGDKQNQCKDLENIGAGSPMSENIDSSAVAPSTVPFSLSTPKQNHKHKHHHHHRCHHHQHNRRHRVKKPRQYPTIVCRQVSDDKNRAVDAKISGNASNKIHDKKPLIITLHEDQAGKPSKGNIPLQSVENKLVSQRTAPAEEAQVGNCSSCICSQPTSPIFTTACSPRIEQIFCEDNCCLPPSTINCASSSCILPQPEPVICCPQYYQPQQQQQQQLFLCTNPNTAQDFICSPSATTQPTIIRQASALNCCSSQPTICLSQPSVQPATNIIIQQQPQVQPQAVQILQAAAQVQPQQIQIIQAPQSQLAQYLQISSSTPQIIGTIQAPGVQHFQPQIIQVPTQGVVASPQILYQRPYDPIALPVQNQQLALAQSPLVALSQPSYAPARIANTVGAPQNSRGPHLFQNALIRTVANRTGLPVLSPNIGNFQFPQSSVLNPTRGAALASTASALLNPAAQPPTSASIVPLSAGGVLIPFQPSDAPKPTMHGTRPQMIGFQTSPRNFQNIQQQIQQRARLLAELQRLSSGRVPSLPIQSVNRAIPPPALPSLFARNAPVPAPGFSSSGPIGPSRFAPNMPVAPPVFPTGLRRSPSINFSNIPQPPVIRSQPPNTSRNGFDTSSSSSSRSSASFIAPVSTNRAAPSNLVYSTPSAFVNRPADSIVSGPSASYQ